MDFSFVIMLVALFAIMYFLMIRPQQKKMKAEQEKRALLTAGERVLLTSGIFATITHVGERQFRVELEPGLEVTILKGNVARKVEPDEEEFEVVDHVIDEDAIEEDSFDELPEGFVVPEDASALAPQDDSATFDPTPAPGEGIDPEEEPRTEGTK